MQDVAVFAIVVIGWIVLQKYILPRLGIGT